MESQLATPYLLANEEGGLQKGDRVRCVLPNVTLLSLFSGKSGAHL